MSNSEVYSENQLISIPDLVYQYDSSRKEINQTVLIPVIVKAIQNIKENISNLAEDIIVVLIGNNETKQYILVKTNDQILNYLTDIITQVSADVYKVNNSNNSIDLSGNKFFIADNDNSKIYQQIINQNNNQNTNTQQVRISNERKNIIIKSLLFAIVDSNRNINNTFNIDNTVKIMLDLALLPIGPSTTVITRENPAGTTNPTLVRLISAYSIPELSILNKNEYTITKEDNRCIIGMDVGDYIQIKFQYKDTSSPTGNTSKNLLYIKKTNTYSYEIKELDSNFIYRDKEEIVTNEVKLTYFTNNTNNTFTFYYVLGSFAGNGVLETNLISQ